MSNGTALNRIHLEKAIKTYLREKRPDEQLQFIRSASTPQVLLPEFSDDIDSLDRMISEDFFINEKGNWYEALNKGMQLLEPQSGDKAIILMTDSDGIFDPADCWKLLEEKGIRIYTIGFGNRLDQYSAEYGTYRKNLLSNIALATHGQAFFTTKSEELENYYLKIVEEMKLTSAYQLSPRLSSATGELQFRFAGNEVENKVAAPQQIEFLLDASSSMEDSKTKISGHIKIDLVVDALIDLARKLPKDLDIALRAFGHRLPAAHKVSCKDSQLLVSMGKNNRSALIRRIKRINPKGRAAISYSVQRAVADLGKASGSGRIVLITDGGDDCGTSPAETFKKLKEKAKNVKVDIIGLALKDGKVQEELKALADVSGGRYFPVDRESELKGILERYQESPSTLDFEVLDAFDQPVASGPIDQEPKLLFEGVYKIRINAGSDPVVISDVRICAGEPTVFELKKVGKETTFFLVEGEGICDRGY